MQAARAAGRILFQCTCEEDAALGEELGVDGLIVSNHGARQLDNMPSPLDVLPMIRNAVGPDVPLLLDSGVRRGTDIVKALALGATVVGVGRPVLWGLINGGAPGVKSVYAHIAAELKSAMMLSGVTKVTEIKRDHLALTKAV